MTLTGLAFIFHFLPIFLVVYYVTPVKYRNVVLFIGSLAFYALGNPYHLILLMVSVLLNYLASHRIYINNHNTENKSAKSFSRIWLILALVYNIGLLVVFKYFAFAVSLIKDISGIDLPVYELSFPLGLSFFTFQMMSFVIDVYREGYEKKIGIFHFAVYATMFPQIASGPITRYSDIREVIEKPQGTTARMLEHGVTMFALGLSYKILLADKIAALWTDVWRVGPEGMDVATAWLGAFAYSMQIYFDFYGYTLMATGVAMMLGFTLPENFRNPYITKSMTSFWRKWHMTLGRWFTDYLYIPLGGNRCSKGQMVFNLFVVWMCTAIWHGASLNFVIWGLFLFAVITIEKLWTFKWLEKTYVFGHIYMIILIPISWLIFGISNLDILGKYMLRLIGVPIEGLVARGLDKFLSLMSTYWWMIALGLLFCTPYPMRFIEKHRKNYFMKLVILAAFWYSVYQVAISGYNPFIYFGF